MGGGNRLRGRRILVVEDEAAIGIDLSQLLQDLGATIVGPTTTVADSLRSIAESRLDCAVLDVNLGGEQVSTVAEALEGAGVPFVFVTGYSSDRIPAQYKNRPVIEKPYDQSLLVEALATIIAT